MSALISFLGGSAFRMVWGEVSAYLTAKQNQKYEIEKLKLQNDIDSAQHARNLEAVRVQADLGIKTIEVQRNADLERAEIDAWVELSKSTAKSTGIKWLDAWNGSIRPLLATIAISFVMARIVANGFVLTEWDQELFSAILGLFIADRGLAKRGK